MKTPGILILRHTASQQIALKKQTGIEHTASTENRISQNLPKDNRTKIALQWSRSTLAEVENSLTDALVPVVVLVEALGTLARVAALQVLTAELTHEFVLALVHVLTTSCKGTTFVEYSVPEQRPK